jgi:hypothetical protein
MISAVSILCVSAIVLTLIFVLMVIIAFHEEDRVVEIEMHENRKRGPL